MLFNTVTFLYFLVLVYSLYLALYKTKRWQNVLLLVASYVFYGYWDWRFLFLIALSTGIDYSIGLRMGNTDSEFQAGTASKGFQNWRRKALLLTSVSANLGILGFFKYYNFFADSLVDMFNAFGWNASLGTLNIILPVGISFYTFQTMSYTIDIYRGRLQPTRSLLDFAVFVAFFPQLVAGPIERAVNLLPQIEKPRRITPQQVYTGLYLMLWGYFKKMVVADNVGRVSDTIFNNYLDYSGIDLFLGVMAFAVQIYGDFSGYTDIARGVARLMGFELMLNFRLPYFALNPADFWRRWHISLSSWLRDYLYIPLGGNRGGSLATYRNLFLTMVLGGLWHGAAWNFVIWGAYHGLILILYRVFEKRPVHQDPWSGRYPYWVVAGKMALMFGLTLLGWLIFRSSSAHQIGYMLSNLSLAVSPHTVRFASDLVFFSLPLLVVQVYQYFTQDLLVLTRWAALPRVALYSTILLWIIIFGVRTQTEFIYFQF